MLEKNNKTFRSFRNFDNDAFLEKIAKIQLPNSNIHTPAQVYNVYNKFESGFINIIDLHATVKTVYRKRATPIYE